MPKGSPERTAARKEEIISACEKLYQTMSFTKHLSQDLRYITTTRQKKRSFWLFMSGSMTAGTGNCKASFMIMKSLLNSRSQKSLLHPLQTGSSC